MQDLSFAFTIPMGYIRVTDSVEAEGQPASNNERVSAGKNVVSSGVLPDDGHPDCPRAELQRCGQRALARRGDREPASRGHVVAGSRSDRPAHQVHRGERAVGRGRWCDEHRQVQIPVRGSGALLLCPGRAGVHKTPGASSAYARPMAPEALAPAIERSIRASEPDLPLYDVQSMTRALGGGPGFFLVRVGASTAAMLGLLAFALAIVGLYAVVSYLATQRTHEIGVRVAGSRHAARHRLARSAGRRESRARRARRRTAGGVCVFRAHRQLPVRRVRARPADPRWRRVDPWRRRLDFLHHPRVARGSRRSDGCATLKVFPGLLTEPILVTLAPFRRFRPFISQQRSLASARCYASPMRPWRVAGTPPRAHEGAMTSPHLIGPDARATGLKTSLRGHRRAIPDDLLRDASRRLGIMSLMAGGLWTLGTVLGHLAVRSMSQAIRSGCGWAARRDRRVSVVVSVLLFVYTRQGDQDPRRILNLGLGYMVFTALALGLTFHWDAMPPNSIAPQISWIGAVVLMFAAIVPSTPARPWLAGLIAVSMNPAGHADRAGLGPGTSLHRRRLADALSRLPSRRRRGRHLPRRHVARPAGGQGARVGELPARRAARPRRDGRGVSGDPPHARDGLRRSS